MNELKEMRDIFRKPSMRFLGNLNGWYVLGVALIGIGMIFYAATLFSLNEWQPEYEDGYVFVAKRKGGIWNPVREEYYPRLYSREEFPLHLIPWSERVVFVPREVTCPPTTIMEDGGEAIWTPEAAFVVDDPSTFIGQFMMGAPQRLGWSPGVHICMEAADAFRPGDSEEEWLDRVGRIGPLGVSSKTPPRQRKGIRQPPAFQTLFERISRLASI